MEYRVPPAALLQKHVLQRIWTPLLLHYMWIGITVFGKLEVLSCVLMPCSWEALWAEGDGEGCMTWDCPDKDWSHAGRREGHSSSRINPLTPLHCVLPMSGQVLISM